jgi:hypothetical protein
VITGPVSADPVSAEDAAPSSPVEPLARGVPSSIPRTAAHAHSGATAIAMRSESRRRTGERMLLD